jgi:hypothetical protein
MKDAVTRLDYCQYLLVSQINYTLTNFADHNERFSHDQINRYLSGEKITPRLVWENVASQVVERVVSQKQGSGKVGKLKTPTLLFHVYSVSI